MKKGMREDGAFCFLKEFDYCKEGDCSCKNSNDSDDDLIIQYARLLAEEFEDIEKGN